MADLFISINGIEYSDFRSVSIQRSLDTLCAGVSIECNPDLADLKNIPTSSEVIISYIYNPLFYGYVDTVGYHLSPSSKSFRIGARDKTSDLVDCAAIKDPMGFEKSVTLEAIAKELSFPFGIKVISKLNNPHHYPSWFIHFGETVFECLERAAQIENCLLMTNEIGDLVLSKPTLNSDSYSQIYEKENLMEFNYQFGSKSLYSSYQVLAYSEELGNSTQSLDTVPDERITRYRPLIIDAQGFSSRAKERAQWEKEMRYSRANSIQVKVPEWVNQKGELYEPNTLADLRVDSMGIHKIFLIAAVEFTISEEEGYTTTLTLTPPQAFFADPAAEMRMNAFIDLMRRDAQ